MLALFFTALSRRGWTLGFCSHPSLVEDKASPQECGGLLSQDRLMGCFCVCLHDSVLAIAFLHSLSVWQVDQTGFLANPVLKAASLPA